MVSMNTWLRTKFLIRNGKACEGDSVLRGIAGHRAGSIRDLNWVGVVLKGGRFRSVK